jgi:KaiC/GvpD/RAD55 family RecA-like ATPase
MARGITAKTLLNKKFKTFKFDGIWKTVLGEQERGGIWVIYGNEKNGKTTLALLLSEYLTKFENLNYVSAEEGTGFTFQQNLSRAKIDFKNTKIKFYDYLEIEEIDKMLTKRQNARIIVLDNATAYVDDLKTAVLRRLKRDYPDVLFIIMAHMEKNEPTTAMAKLAKKLCNVYFRIEGLTAFVGGRCPGGTITINEQTAMLFHGSEIKNKKAS